MVVYYSSEHMIWVLIA